jgi:hypothetical protein
MKFDASTFAGVLLQPFDALCEILAGRTNVLGSARPFSFTITGNARPNSLPYPSDS